MDRDPRRVANKPALTRDEALQLLANTRRTLIKLVANIDAALEQLAKEERVTPSQ